jgi:hypothetical protein
MEAPSETSHPESILLKADATPNTIPSSDTRDVHPESLAEGRRKKKEHNVHRHLKRPSRDVQVEGVTRNNIYFPCR